MKIRSLQINNFRGHQDYTLHLAPLTIVTGPNGSGKSSIVDALEWLLAGRCSRTNERGQGPIMHNESSSCSVTATLYNDGTISRGNPGRLSCSWAPSHKNPEVPLYQATGCDGDRARLSIQAGRFFGLDHKDARSVLFELLELHVLPSQVTAGLAELPDSNATATALKIVGQSRLTDLEYAEKQCRAARTEAGKQVAQLTTLLQPLEKQTSEEVFASQAETEALLTKSRDLLFEYRNLVAGRADWEPANHAKMLRSLEKMEEAPEGAYCEKCGHPSKNQIARDQIKADLQDAIAKFVQDAPGHLARIDEEIAKTQAELEATQELLHSHESHRESYTNLINHRKRLHEQQSLHATLEHLVAFFGSGPGSLMASTIKPKIHSFEQAVNSVLGYWGRVARYKPDLSVEVAPLLPDGRRPWADYKALSDGEQILVSLAHQVAFAQRTGLGIVCLDRIEALDPAGQDTLISACLGLLSVPDSGIDHVLLLGVRVDASSMLESPGVRLVDLARQEVAL